MKRYKCYLNNLDCANCAVRVQEELENNNIKNVNVNFANSTLYYDAPNDMQEAINEMIKRVEPDVYVTQLEEENLKKSYHLLILLIAIIFGVVARFFEGNIKLYLYSLSYILLLYKIAFKAVKALVKNKKLDENALVTISAIGAYFLGQELEGVMVVVLYTIGKILEAGAINNSRKSIKDLVNIKEPFVNKIENEKTIKCEVEKVQIGDILLVKKGEKIPVDGIVIKGRSKLDTSSLTGESEPSRVNIDSEVLSGSVNLGSAIYIKVEKTYEDSTASKVLELLNQAGEKKAKTENVVERVSKYYTPIVFLLAIIVTLTLPLFTDLTLKNSLYRALTFLVIACPCAIVISVPLSFFTGIGVASRKGILIKGSNFLDNLSNINNIIFDKTGTLTNGITKVSNIKIYDETYKKSELIELLIKGESFSTHPIANAFMKLSNDNIDNLDVEHFREMSGKGISYTVDGKKVLVGSKRLCKCDIGSGMHMHINGKHVASIEINDGIKKGADDAIKKLKSYGITTYMFTGDRESVAREVGRKLGIDNIEFEMLPKDKFECFEKIANDKTITAFVGDGINDAPTLKRADIGISLGTIGTDSAIEASDIVIMNDDLTKIPLAIRISKYTRKIILENLCFALSIKILVLILSILGIANMWMSVLADTGVTLLTILNALRIIKKFKS